MGQIATVARPSWSAKALFKWEARALAFGVLAASFVVPINGLSVDLCPIHAASGLPCPGCGLSRGIASVSQGHFGHAWRMNPFSYLAWLGFVGMVVYSMLPKHARASVSVRMTASSRAALVYKWSVLAFAAFGAARFMVFLVAGWKFP